MKVSCISREFFLNLSRFLFGAITSKRKITVILLLIFSCVHSQAQVERDSVVSKYIKEINPDSIASYIQSLQDFGTRYALADNKDEVVGWIAGKFNEFGYDAEIDSFESIYSWKDSILVMLKNVSVTIPGTDPDKNIILSAHYDAVIVSYQLDPVIIAPGADDNASGVAAILEIARVLKNYDPAINIKFIAFDSEEIYCDPNGSRYFAKKAIDTDIKISLVINYDMIGYNTQPVDSWFVEVQYHNESDKKYNDFATLVTNYHTSLKERKGTLDPAPGDGGTISRYNIPVIQYVEDEFNPYYHTSNDLLQNLDIAYCTEVIKASCAGLLAFLEMPETKVNNFKVQDGGDGQSLVLSWSPDAGFSASGYNIYLGSTDYDFDTLFTTPDTTFIINNLTEDSTYYVRITPFNSRGYEGFVEGGTGVPKHLPLSPSGIADEPFMHEVKLTWNRNLEYDLAGYNLYRSTTPGGEEILLNSVPLTDTFYVDEGAQNGYYYYYTIKAVDIENNESLQNETIRSRVISLDQGILLVDESTDGSGAIMSPTDEQTDSFYNSLLADFNNKNYDISSEGGIKLADLGAFSTILWHNGDLLSTARIESDMRKYLDYGGKLLFTGYIPSKVFTSNYSTYPKDFEPGDFVYDYLKISGTDLIFGSRFRAGIGQTGYPDIFTDTVKTRQEQLYHLTNIESITAVPGAVTNYLYDTQYDTLSPYGKMKGRPVGVEYLGDDFKVVALSFPLYYMNYDQAKELVNYVLLEKFDEITSIEEERGDKFIPEEYYLSQNYPNPFNPNTIIKYQIPVNGLVSLKIYDILGKEIVTLVNAEKSAGRYEVDFNASDLASGVYIYRVKVNEFVESRKMILMK